MLKVLNLKLIIILAAGKQFEIFEGKFYFHSLEQRGKYLHIHIL